VMKPVVNVRGLSRPARGAELHYFCSRKPTPSTLSGMVMTSHNHRQTLMAASSIIAIETTPSPTVHGDNLF
jgi:hypothetical protein